jgi:ribosomal protein S18 acetylase RimI-like enzyme
VNVTIRPARNDDYAWAAAGMATSEPWITLNRDADSAFAVLSDRAKELYVAERGGDRIGFVLIDMRGTLAGYIQSLYVAPQARSGGVGSVLMRFAERRIFSEQPNVFLCVSSFNEAAMRFYRREGYVQVGVFQDFIIAGASEVLLRKSIGPKLGFVPARGMG